MISTLADFMQAKGLNQSQVARAIGKSPSVINQFLQGKYAGDVSAIETDINNFIRRQREKEAAKKAPIKFIETETAMGGLKVCSLAHTECDINVIYGEAGMGKTMILSEYANNDSSVILIEADPGYTTRAVLERLCQQLGAKKTGSIHEVMDECIDKLRGSERLLLIDEAENLPYRALETIRRIHDKAGVGVVLAGTPRLITNLKGRRGEYKQLYSRVGLAYWVGGHKEIHGGNSIPVNELPLDDFRRLAASIVPGADEEHISDALFKHSGGNARRLYKLLRGVNRHCIVDNKAISVKAIEKFSRMLIN
ncbi:AAA family ATPase [Salmonella enterica]